MERYNEYKDSGVQWIGEIPSHWKVLSPRYWITRRDAGNWGSDQEGNDQDAVCIRIADFDYGHLCIKKDCEYTVRNYPKEILKNLILKRGDIIVEKSGGGDKFPVGRAVLYDLDFPALFANFSERIRVDKKYSNKYMLYSFAAHYSMGLSRLYFNQTTGLQNLIMSKFMREVKLPLPPLTEQKSIVVYLDTQTSHIDSFIANVEREIELLGEAKQRIIADAVTEGLKKDVEMKDSNVPFQDKVPAHWKEIKMKYLFNERSEKNHPDETMLSATQTQGVIPQNLYGQRVVVVSKGFENLKFVKKGDFVIHLRSFQGGIEYAYYQGIISAAYTILEPKSPEYADFYKYLFKSHNYIQILKTCVTGIREGQNINYSVLGRKHIALPPIEEANEIVNFISQKTSQIDALISSLSQQITALKEYKQRLISDVVTGQMNVQNEL